MSAQDSGLEEGLFPRLLPALIREKGRCDGKGNNGAAFRSRRKGSTGSCFTESLLSQVSGLIHGDKLSRFEARRSSSIASLEEQA